MINIKDNLAEVEQQIKQACILANRPNNSVNLLAVSKTKPNHMIEQAYKLGQRHFGENYVQEGVDKILSLAHLQEINWHFIGPIQSNKTRLISQHFNWVHSIDRLKIAQRLSEQRLPEQSPLNVCIQVNISEEENKTGITSAELPTLAKQVNELPHLCLRGLMAIPEKKENQTSFIKMEALFNEFKAIYPTVDTLSMGMSADLTSAVAHGSTLVRIGSAIFGARTPA